MSYIKESATGVEKVMVHEIILMRCILYLPGYNVWDMTFKWYDWIPIFYSFPWVWYILCYYSIWHEPQRKKRSFHQVDWDSYRLVLFSEQELTKISLLYFIFRVCHTSVYKTRRFIYIRETGFTKIQVNIKDVNGNCRIFLAVSSCSKIFTEQEFSYFMVIRNSAQQYFSFTFFGILVIIAYKK